MSLERGPSGSWKCGGFRHGPVVAGIALGLGAALLGARALQERLAPKRFVVVESGFLYRSGEIAPGAVRELLEEHHIRKVVWLLHYEESKRAHRAEKEAIDALGIAQVNLSLRGDGTGKLGRYVAAVAEIAAARQAGEAVLVQCAGGARRSGAVVALYLLLVEGRTAEEAYRELARFGSPVADTPLVAYLNDHMREIAEALVARGVIPRVPAPLPLLRPPARSDLWTWLSARRRAGRGLSPP